LHGEGVWSSSSQKYLQLQWGFFDDGDGPIDCESLPYRQIVKPQSIGDNRIKFTVNMVPEAVFASQCLPSNGGEWGSRKHLACVLGKKSPPKARGCLGAVGSLTNTAELREPSQTPGVSTQRDYIAACTKNLGFVGTKTCSESGKGIVNPSPQHPEVKSLFFCSGRETRSTNSLIKAASVVQFNSNSKEFCWYPTEERVIGLESTKLPLADGRVEGGVHIAGVTEREVTKFTHDSLLYNLTVDLDISHDDTRDLAVWLIHINEQGKQFQTMVFNGGIDASNRNHLKKVFSPANQSTLSQFLGRSTGGTWLLRIEDRKARRTGMLRQAAVSFFSFQ
jgi:hypothetical protein